jgi:carbon-monoxide dehydrogenase large subunit
VRAIGGALLEQFIYDEHGNPIATTFFDYLLPELGDAPELLAGLSSVSRVNDP